MYVLFMMIDMIQIMILGSIIGMYKGFKRYIM